MASIVSGPFLACCAVLALAGARKTLQPTATRSALAALRLPHSAAAVRTIGVGEVAIALVGALLGGPFALLVAGAYGLLAIVAWRLARQAPGTACGCLGASSTPVGGAHVVVDLAATFVAVAAATGSAPATHLPDESALLLALVVLVGSLTYITTLLIDTHPALRVALQRGRSR